MRVCPEQATAFRLSEKKKKMQNQSGMDNCIFFWSRFKWNPSKAAFKTTTEDDPKTEDDASKNALHFMTMNTYIVSWLENADNVIGSDLFFFSL